MEDNIDIVERLKLAAQDVIDQAEDIVGKHDHLAEVQVTITVPAVLPKQTDPDISVSKSFYSDKVIQHVFENW